MKIQIASQYSNEWSRAQDLVRRKYQRTFHADVLPSPDYFVVVLQPEGIDNGSKVIACAGLTFSSVKPFFSEQYLDEPIEKVISTLEYKSINRDAIVEVGSLASLQNSVGVELIKIMPIITWCLGKEYIFCTVTKQMKRIFSSINLPFESIYASDYRRLDEYTQKKWGIYYEKLPETGFIRLNAISSLFTSNTGRYRFLNLEIAMPVLKQQEVEHSKNSSRELVSSIR